MLVLFLTLYPECAASPRYRVGQFVPHLRRAGIDCTVACPLSPEEHAALTGPGRTSRPFWYHFKETPRRLRQLMSGGRYDVVFVQKAIMTAYVRGFVALLRSRARRLVYDFDDAVHLAPPHPLRGMSRVVEDRSQVYKILASAHLVLAGNAWLTEAARTTGADATLFPTVVDTDRFVPSSTSPDLYRVGWIGNPSTTRHLAWAKEALAGLSDAEVVLVGADPAAVPWPGAEVRPWSLDTEVAEVQRFSVGIMPLPDDEWSRGKCGLKALQYMACGVPCVASPRGAAQDIIEHEENGLLADSPDEWREALEQLRNPSLRRRLGDAGRATVEAKFSLQNAAPRLQHLLEEVV